MTSPTPEGALAEERALGEQRMAQIRAEAFRAGAEAMRERCAARIEEGGRAWAPIATDIRSLSLPEEPR